MVLNHSILVGCFSLLLQIANALQMFGMEANSRRILLAMYDFDHPVDSAASPPPVLSNHRCYFLLICSTACARAL